MNTLELKRGMIEMIASIKSPELLKKLYDLVEEITLESRQEVAALTPDQENQLDRDLAASELEENLVSHEEAVKTMSRWL
ncbi:MAG: hypothetical protein AAGG68_13955 [Bacteroidota bacterium]